MVRPESAERGALLVAAVVAALLAGAVARERVSGSVALPPTGELGVFLRAGATLLLLVASGESLLRHVRAGRHAPATRSRRATLRLATALVFALVALPFRSWGPPPASVAPSEIAVLGEEVAFVAALYFLAALLPIEPLPGGRLLFAALAAERPQLVAARLSTRVGNTALLLLAGGLFLVAPVRAALPTCIGLPAATALAVGQSRRNSRRALAREAWLQRAPAERAPEALRARLDLSTDVPLEPLSREQFAAFAPLCARAYARFAGTPTSATNPATSSATSSQSEAP